MKNVLLKSLLIFAALYSLTASTSLYAGLYKGLDDEGNVIYSDKPFDNAEPFTPPTLTIMDTPKAQPEEDLIEEEQTPETTYTKLAISAPTNDQTIRNTPDVSVALQLTPALSVSEGHSTWLLLDGKPLVEKSQSLLMQIGRLDRGQHTLQAQVRNKQGKIIKRSKVITIHIKNTFIRQPKPTPQ